MNHSDPATVDNEVLIIEDNDDFRLVLQEVLQRQGYRAVGCASAVDALAVLQSGRRFCLIVLDLMMPGLSGFHFREEQRHSDTFGDIPVIVVTAAMQPALYDGNLRALAYLTKPVDFDQMIGVIRRHCPLPAMTQ